MWARFYLAGGFRALIPARQLFFHSPAGTFEGSTLFLRPWPAARVLPLPGGKADPTCLLLLKWLILVLYTSRVSGQGPALQPHVSESQPSTQLYGTYTLKRCFEQKLARACWREPGLLSPSFSRVCLVLWALAFAVPKAHTHALFSLVQ